MKNAEKRILITTGGTDPFNITYKLLSICLCDEVFASYSYDVIVGSMNVYEAQLKEMEHQYPPIKIHKNITNMSDYMRVVKWQYRREERHFLNCVHVEFQRCVFRLQKIR